MLLLQCPAVPFGSGSPRIVLAAEPLGLLPLLADQLLLLRSGQAVALPGLDMLAGIAAVVLPTLSRALARARLAQRRLDHPLVPVVPGLRLHRYSIVTITARGRVPAALPVIQLALLLRLERALLRLLALLHRWRRPRWRLPGPSPIIFLALRQRRLGLPEARVGLLLPFALSRGPGVLILLVLAVLLFLGREVPWLRRMCSQRRTQAERHGRTDDGGKYAALGDDRVHLCPRYPGKGVLPGCNYEAQALNAI
jgi:hypothetical protein